jgi:hypothetical protein
MGKTGVDDQAFAADNHNCKRIGFIEHTAQEMREDNKGVRSNLCVTANCKRQAVVLVR